MDQELAAILDGEFIEGTACNVRFVLDTMLTLEVKHVNKKKSLQIETNLNYLSTMAALNQEVAWFLVDHYFFTIIEVSLPVIECMQTRVTVVKFVRKMCQHSGVANTLANEEQLLTSFLLLLKFSDVKLQNQVFGLIQVILCNTDDERLINVWNSFTKTEFSETLFFLLHNSKDRNLLSSVLKCLEIMFHRCAQLPSKHVPFIADKFLCLNIMQTLNVALTELVIHQCAKCAKNDCEKVFHMCLYIIYFFNKMGLFERESVQRCQQDAKIIVETILYYYENVIVHLHEVHMHLVDLLKIISGIAVEFELANICDPDKYVTKLYNIWRLLRKPNSIADYVIINLQFSPKLATEDMTTWNELNKKLLSMTAVCICSYLEGCSERHLSKVYNDLGDDFIPVMTFVHNSTLLRNVGNRLKKNILGADGENDRNQS